MKILERVDVVEKYDHIVNNFIGLGSTKTCSNFKRFGSNFKAVKERWYTLRNKKIYINVYHNFKD